MVTKHTKYFYDVQLILFLSLIVVFLYLYLNFLWRKRDMIIKSWNVPGPLNLPIIGIGYRFMKAPELIAETIDQMQSKYPRGGKIWFGNKLIYSLHEPDHIEKILGNSRLVEKALSLYKPVTDVIGEGLFTAPMEKWKRLRRHIQPTFNQKILESFVPIFDEQTSVLCDILAKNPGTEIDLQKILSKCMLDVVLETIMGLRLDIQKTESDYPRAFEALMGYLFQRIFHVWYHIDFLWKHFGKEKCVKEESEKFYALIDLVLKEKMEAIKARKQTVSSLDCAVEEPIKRLSFLDYLIESQELDPKELREEINIFLLAGSDTTTSTLCFVFTLLGMHPEIQQKVYEEVVRIIGKDRSPDFKDLPYMHYTECVIRESLRIFPPATFWLRHLYEDVDVGDFIIPKGSCIFFGTLFIHRNPKYWPDPLKFDPDRFLPEEVAKRHPCTYIPFSYGPRNCIGIKYGMMSMKVAVANVVRKFQIHCGHKKIENMKIRSVLVSRLLGDYKVSFTPRKTT